LSHVFKDDILLQKNPAEASLCTLNESMQEQKYQLLNQMLNRDRPANLGKET